MKDIHKGAIILALVLFVCYAASFGARHIWFLDLLRHFVFQYFIGAVILGVFFAWRRSRLWLGLMVFTALMTGGEIIEVTTIAQNTSLHSDKKTLNIVTYNRKYTIDNHKEFTAWLRKESPDIVVILEARTTHSAAAKGAQDLYPYQIHEPRRNAFGMIFMSKYPFIEQSVVETKRYALNNFYIRAVISPIDNKQISIYAAHPPPPLVKLVAKQRNEDLKTLSKAIENDTNNNIIFVGDWNITPYSPYFLDLLKNTELKNQYINYYMTMTWPSVFILPIFQIPIDHILHKGDLELIDKRRGPAMGSDHYPLIATFALQ